MLADSRWPYHAVSEQHRRRCRVTTAGLPQPRWAAVAEGGVALRMDIIGWSRPFALLGVKTRTVSSLWYTWAIMLLCAHWLTTVVPCRPRAAQSPLWSDNGGATAARVGRGRSRGSRPSYAYHSVQSPSRPVWRIDTSSTVFTVFLAHNASTCSLAGDGRAMPSANSAVAVV